MSQALFAEMSAEPTVLEGAYLPSGLGAERAMLWTVDRALWRPRTIKTGGGAALTAGRANTAYRKIVDVLASDLIEFRTLVEAAARDVPPNPDGIRPAPVVIKFEEHPHIAPLSDDQRAVLMELGFVESPAPMPSVPSTRHDSPSFTRAWSKWLQSEPTRSAPYYGQTTDITCGPSAALMLLESASLGRLTDYSDDNHAAELALWRNATNTIGCDPFSLALATAEEIAGNGLRRHQPKLTLSAQDLVLVEEGTPLEDKMREIVQRDSLRRIERSGLELDRRWFTVEELRDIVANGSDVLLMITLEPLIGDATPHWILVHDAIGDTLIISDPWVDAEKGESWVDCSELPVPLAAVDLMARLGSPVCRGLIEVAPR